MRAHVDVQAIKGRREENILTWRQQLTIRPMTPGAELEGDGQAIDDLLKMRGVVRV